MSCTPASSSSTAACCLRFLINWCLVVVMMKGGREPGDPEDQFYSFGEPLVVCGWQRRAWPAKFPDAGLLIGEVPPHLQQRGRFFKCNDVLPVKLRPCPIQRQQSPAKRNHPLLRSLFFPAWFLEVAFLPPTTGPT